MFRFYRYVIYRFHDWRIKKNDDVPGATIVFTMVSIHFLQLCLLMMVLNKIFPSLSLFKLDKITILVFYLVLSLFYYLFIYRPYKMEDLKEEFKNQTIQERKRGTFFVLLFTAGSVAIFFAACFLFIFI
jgi:hypothetical protein